MVAPYMGMNQFPAAKTRLETGHRIAIASNHLAFVSKREGDLKQAQHECETATTILEELGQRRDAIKLRNNLAGIFMQQEQWAEAAFYFLQALEGPRT